MHLTTSDEEIAQDQAQISNGDTLNRHQIEQIASTKYDTFDKEPRAVYIALRESKSATAAMQNEVMIGERLNIMPSLQDDIVGGGVEYVTLEDCRLIAGEDLIPEDAHFNVDGMTDVRHLRGTLPNTSGVKVLVQPLFGQTENPQVNEFTMPMQSIQQHASNVNITTNNILPINSFNHSLPTEPLPYEEAYAIQKCVMEITSPSGKENSMKLDESMDSTKNLTYLDSSVPSMRYSHMQIQETVYSPNSMREFNTSSNGLHSSSQFDTRENEFEQIDASPAISSKQVASPPSSSSPTYSLSESHYIHTSTAINKQSSQRISSNFDSNGPVSPSESSSSYGSQESSISSTSKRQMSIEEKRLRLYSESWTPSNTMVTSNRARHQSDGHVGCRTRTKKFQTSRSSIDRKNSENSTGKRRSKNPMPENSKDDKYWRRRAKNNEAAKRSREAKRQKEDEVQQRVEVLVNERDLLRDKLEEALSEIRVLKAKLNKDDA